MERGLYIAASGMVAQQARQDQLANDLANASTAGYKADRVTTSTFGEMLLGSRRTGQPIGTLGFGVQIARQTTDLRAQPLKETGEPLDLAIEGDGFFGVRTPQGIRYTRDGSFVARADGTLGDQLGNPVLDANRAPVRVDAGGTVRAEAIGVFNVPAARKAGDGHFTGQARGEAAGTVRTGVLEASSVDPTRAMVDLIASLRTLESSQKAITTIDDTLRQAATQVGTIT